MANKENGRKRSMVLIIVLIILAALLAAGICYGGFTYLNNRIYDSELPVVKNTKTDGTGFRADLKSSDIPVVYMTEDISPEGLVNIYRALEWKPEGKVAVKLSTGEPPNSNYLRPELIEDLDDDFEMRKETSGRGRPKFFYRPVDK